MSRFTLLLYAFFLLAFAQKDEDYFRQNIDEANKIVQNRCHDYLSASSRMAETFKDPECEAAAKVSAENIDIKSRQALVTAVEKFLKNLPDEKSYSKDEKLRYAIYTKNFINSPGKSEELFIGCMEDKAKVRQNKAECRAGAEAMLKKLQLEQQEVLAKMDRNEKYIDNFKKNPGQIEEILNGRCKSLLQNPWYKFDPSLKNKECEAALIVKEILGGREVIQKDQSAKGKEYFRKNISEAVDYITNCKNTKLGLSSQECTAAESVVKEQENEKEMRAKYRQYFSKNINEAKRTSRDCGEKIDISSNDELKCRAALEISGEYFQMRRNLKKKEGYKETFRSNIASARKKIADGCLENQEECEAAAEVISEEDAVRIRESLIKELQEAVIEQKAAEKALPVKEQSKFENYKKHFQSNQSDAEEVATICIKDAKNGLKNNSECIAATTSLLAILLQQKDEDEKNKVEKSKAYGELQKRLTKNPAEIERMLSGRCRDVFSDSWYKLDPDLEDQECNTALAIKNRNLLLSQEKQHAKQNKLIKDRTYFINNMEEAEKTSTKCKSGVVADISECEFSISVVNERIIEENKRIEYQAYYNGHALAAKFQIKWCKSSMLNFNIKCQAAENALKIYESKKPKIYSEELLVKHINKLKGDLSKVKEVLNGKCKLLMDDSWYYLDESIRSEECDAAAEIAKAAMEQQDKKQ